MDNIVGDICGHVVVVMAPMGSGKGTIVHRALKEHPEVYHTVSCTSRAIRNGEIDGEHYHFITSNEFDGKVEAEEFLEWAEFAGNKYGTLKSEIIPYLEKGQIVITEIDLQGVEQLISLLPRQNITVVYIEAGGWEVLRARAEARSPMSEEELKKRHERYLIEKQSKPIADIIINNTNDIDSAYTEFNQIINSAYTKCK